MNTEELKNQIPEADSVTTLLDKTEDVCGFKLQPWRFKEYEQIIPIVEKISLDMKKRNLTYKDFFQIKKKEDEVGSTDFDLLNYEQLLFLINPYIRPLLKISANATDEAVDKITPDELSVILLKIVVQNIGYLKNWLALGKILAGRVLV
jgi:hypothetical protein